MPESRLKVNDLVEINSERIQVLNKCVGVITEVKRGPRGYQVSLCEPVQYYEGNRYVVKYSEYFSKSELVFLEECC